MGLSTRSRVSFFWEKEVFPALLIIKHQHYSSRSRVSTFGATCSFFFSALRGLSCVVVYSYNYNMPWQITRLSVTRMSKSWSSIGWTLSSTVLHNHVWSINMIYSSTEQHLGITSQIHNERCCHQVSPCLMVLYLRAVLF